MDPRNMADLLRWFREAWTSEMPARLHDRGHEEDGSPHWHAAFRSYIAGSDWATDQDGSVLRPVRAHFSGWAHSSGRNCLRARLLFVLACHDFDPAAAWEALRGPAVTDWDHMHREDTTEATLRRFWRACQHEPRRFLPPRDRGALARVGKSESQHRAEEAA
jgi:hypothetical protein